MKGEIAVIVYRDYVRKCRERHMFPLPENEFNWEVEQLNVAPESEGLSAEELDKVTLSALLKEDDSLIEDDEEEPDDGPGVKKFKDWLSSD